MTDLITATKNEAVLVLELNRADKKNALTQDMYSALTDYINEASGDPQTSAILLCAKGPTFSAGNDLTDFIENPPTDTSAPVFQFMLTLASAKIPIVAAVSGAAIGIGTTLLLHCDLVYADETASFATPFLKLGVCAEAGASALLPMLCGRQKASEILMFGESLSAQDAKDLGLVNQIYSQDELRDKVLGKVTLLAAQSRTALISNKSLIKQSSFPHLEEVIKREAAEFMRLLQTPESKKAIASFFSS